MSDDREIDLRGRPCPRAQNILVGICRGGETIGVDLLDRDDQPIAHAHFDVKVTLDLAAQLLALSDTLIQILRSARDNREIH